jgi:HEAT repeat protein
MNAPEEIEFIEVLKALLDLDNPLPARFLHRLSDLDSFEFDSLKETWLKIPLWRRRALMEDIEELCKDDYLVSYESLGVFAAEDADPLVRLHAVRTLWEFENKSLIPTFVRLLRNDPDVEVRAASASALGHYVYLGELDELPARILNEIEILLLDITQGNEEIAIRRAALEALGFSSREEVPALIEAAFNSGDVGWRTSALFAMGRSRNEIWKNQVLSMLNNNQPDLRMEAARAAGELEITDAVPILLELLDDPSDSIRDASIWSLSQIGGEGVRDRLETLFDEAEDDREIDYLESALDNLVFTEGMQLMPLFDLSEQEDAEDFDETAGDESSFLNEDDEDLED